MSTNNHEEQTGNHNGEWWEEWADEAISNATPGKGTCRHQATPAWQHAIDGMHIARENRDKAAFDVFYCLAGALHAGETGSGLLANVCVQFMGQLAGILDFIESSQGAIERGANAHLN